MPSHETLQRVAKSLSTPRPVFIGEPWLPGRLPPLDVHNPASGEIIAKAHAADVQDADAAVIAARAAFEGRAWRRMPPSDRARRLWRLAELVEANAAELAVLETLNEGMPVSLAEVLAATGPADSIRYYSGWCTKVEGSTSSLSLPDPRPRDAFGPAHHAFMVREPIGVIAAITPWNAPMAMATAKIIPALATGNTVVLKPAELTPLTALRLAELVEEADFPPGTLNVIPGAGQTVGAHLAAHPAVDLISFTGSTATGKLIGHAAMGNLKRVALELGGKSPVLAFADADLAQAIPTLADAVFMNAGQICFAGTRIYVERPVYNRVIEGVAAIAQSIRVGPGMDSRTQMGPLISARQRDSVMRYIDGGKREGAGLVAGGTMIDSPGYFVSPTVFAAASNHHTIVREEIFGPVVTILPFDGIEEGVRLANDTSYGLAAGVFTESLRTAHAAAAELRAGSVWINCYAMLDEAMPAGGYRQSGWGREAGRIGVEEFTQVKSVVAAL